MAADDVARAVGRIAVATPVNGIVEVGGPEQFRFEELIRQGLEARNDPRHVVADPDARYFGTKLTERQPVAGRRRPARRDPVRGLARRARHPQLTNPITPDPSEAFPMSPRLLYLLTTGRTQLRFTRQRDRIDARRAATRMPTP